MKIRMFEQTICHQKMNQIWRNACRNISLPLKIGLDAVLKCVCALGHSVNAGTRLVWQHLQRKSLAREMGTVRGWSKNKTIGLIKSGLLMQSPSPPEQKTLKPGEPLFRGGFWLLSTPLPSWSDSPGTQVRGE